MSAKRTMRILGGEDVKKALTMPQAIAAMRAAFLQLSKGNAQMPTRAHIDIPKNNGNALFMPSYMESENVICIKTVTLFPDNTANDLPLIQGVVCLFDATNGCALAILDAPTLTSLRTGAASGLATGLLAREDASTAAIFGAGVQGRTQLLAVSTVRDLKKVWVYDKSESAAEKFAREMSQQLDVDVRIAATPADALAFADIVCTATVSQTPVFDDESLAKGTHINAIGSYKPHVQEIPLETVIRSKVVVDHKHSALEETGDLIIPIEQGVFSPERIYAELGDLISEKVSARTSPDEITLFKSVGVAVQDLTAATVAVNNAEEQNIGTLIKW